MNQPVSIFLGQLPVAQTPPNSYLGANGLFYCSSCNTPVQCRVMFGKVQKTMPCLCSCQAKAREEQQQLLKEQERLLHIRRLKATGIQERYLLNCTFTAADDSHAAQIAKQYVAHWTEAKAQNLGLLFWGAVGTGKSFLAACIANALIERGIPVLMTSFPKILNRLGGMYPEERYGYLSSFSDYPLLILDDLGAERNTDYALEQIFTVVDERYKARLPLVITTNLTVAQLRTPEDAAHARIFSRLLEMCTPVHVAGEDRRIQTGKMKQGTAKDLLLGDKSSL